MILPLGGTSVTQRVGEIAPQISSCANPKMHLFLFSRHVSLLRVTFNSTVGATKIRLRMPNRP